MPIRTASLTKKISANGQLLHLARQRRIESGAKEPSEAEAAVTAERALLKEERDKRSAQAQQPRRSAVDRLVRTHHPEAKHKPKVKSAAHDAGETKKPKTQRTRAEKH